ncbi:hypothetical protein V5799_026267 [Amblyomma americanum]|uniref:Secreted protein n=1 Tax=Amblyomma americanum TaxID=6943 RepID=A0AAQ4DJ26_AMBAM
MNSGTSLILLCFMAGTLVLVEAQKEKVKIDKSKLNDSYFTAGDEDCSPEDGVCVYTDEKTELKQSVEHRSFSHRWNLLPE